MAARPETARKILIYWMDGVVAMIAVIIVAFTVGRLMAGAISPAHAAVTIACQLGLCGLFPFVLREGFDHRPRPTWKLLLSGLFALGATLLRPPTLDNTAPWIELGTLWLAGAALYLPPRVTAGLSAAVAVLFTAYSALVYGQSWTGVLAGITLNIVLMVPAMILWRWLWWIIRDANNGREARARLAVAEERLRFARDLHDLLGHSLSVITLKSELAAKLATKDAGRALAEMTEVRGLAGDSLAKVQQAVHGYQALDLDQELAGVRAALEASGARCAVRARAGGLSPAARALLAWVVREGGTNVLKHSEARNCSITIEGGVLEMRNDGVPAAGPGTGATFGAGAAPGVGAAPGAGAASGAGAGAASGSGLRGLAERLAEAGGTLSAAPGPGGEFVLRASVPVAGEVREAVSA
ncbi:histidine kinase [Actinomadura sp. ATCC 31491]|uniref:Histidine kinase n=1 Tax=Actinomadura luzonensis TaxID=2805427 RepID=A0ABT0FZF7_9ACTN|nr:histidine kinase [Actinomadura luzonensis]MCK2217533.1 histidine kinase [Actinomadura luzonensis]